MAEEKQQLVDLEKQASKITQADLEAFSKEVMRKMALEKIPPLPNYYELYFETLLQDKPFDFRKEIIDQLGAQSGSGDEQRMVIESKIKEGFDSVKEILQSVAVIYKYLVSSIETSNKRSEEAKTLTNPVSIKNFAGSLANDSEALSLFVAKQAGALKDLYTKTANIVKAIETESIFDPKYAVYNKRYVLGQIEREKKVIAKFGHSTTLILIMLKSTAAIKIGSEKGVSLVNKTMAKLFMKTSRRSDIVAYFGDGIFAMLLKHTDTKNAVRTAERLNDMMRSTNFFLGDREIELTICSSITPIKVDIETDSIVLGAVDALKECDRSPDDKIYALNEL